MADGVSGGVQQWIIGLANALSRLEGTAEEYLFLVSEGHDWLLPYLSGPCRVFARARPGPRGIPDAAPPEAGRRSSRSRALLRPLRKAVKRVRRLWRDRRTRKPEPWRSSIDQIIREGGADVMHFPRQSAFETAVPSLYQPWDLQHRHLPEFFTPEARARRDSTYRAACAMAKRVIVATQWVKDDVAAQYGIPPGRIFVVNPPPVTRAYVPPRPGDVDGIASQLGLPDAYAFYPAQTWGHKNHGRLLEALAQLHADGLDVPLVCSGQQNDGDAAVLERARALGIAPLVRLLGYLTPTEIQVVYQRSRMLVYPSLYEGWGLPILEAFAADVPVACSTATSLPALVGDAGLLFDPTDVPAISAAVKRLWLDAPLRGVLRERGRARLGQFDWDRTARLVRAHYREVGGRPLSRDDRALLGAAPLV